MASTPFTNDIAVSFAGLTEKQAASLLKKLVKFEGKVEAGKTAKIKIGTTTYKFTKGGTANTDVKFLINGTSQTPTGLVAATVVANDNPSSGGGGTTPTPAPTAAPQALTTSTTDVLIGTSGNDTFTGVASTYDDTDRLVDGSTKDADVFNLSESGAVNPDVINVETVNITISSLAADAVDASKMVGATTLTVTRGDVSVGGSTITGNKVLTVNNLDASGVTKVVAGAGTASVDINAAATDKAGLVLDAAVVTGDVAVDGAATISAGASTGTVAVDAVSNTDATETAKATSITADKAATVTTHADLTGSVTISAAAATAITVNDAQGGATVTGSTTSTADSTITVVDIDSSGATITTGTGSSVAAEKQISVVVDGTTKTTDAVSISGNGVIALDLDGAGAETVDLVTLGGSTAAVTYNVGTNASTITSITKAGTQSVTVAGDESLFSGVTITNIDVVDLNAGTAGAIDASKFSGVGSVKLGFDNASNAITVADAAKFVISVAQTGAGTDFDYTTGAKNMTIEAGDVNGTSNTAVGTLTLAGTLNAAAGATDVGTVTIVANDANLTVATATTLGAKQTLVVSGDEDVSLGTVTALAVNASASTGIITLTATTGVTDAVQTGSGDDVLTANGADIHTFSAGGGGDTITITSTQATSQFSGGDGNDTINANTAGAAYVITGDSGDDKINTASDLEAVIVGGSGNDTLDIGAATIDFSDNTTFAFTGIETLDLTDATGTTKISASQLANNSTLSIVANGDTLEVNTDSTKGGTLDASKVTIATGSTAVLNYVGSAKNDTITGGVAAEIFTMTAGDDVIDGGTSTGKVDKFTAITTADTGTGVAAIINLSGSAVTATSVLANTGLRTAGDGSIAAGTAATLFNDTTSTNDAATTSLSNIESVVGTSGKDYIVAASTSTTIEGGAGADYIVLGASADTVNLTTAVTADTISGFQIGAGGDIINVQGLDADINDALKVATLSSGGGTLTSIGGTATAADVDVIVLLNTTGFADTNAINTELQATAAAITDTDGAIVVAFNSTTTKIEVYYVDNESGGTGTLSLVGTLDGLTSASLANLVAANFA